MEDGKFLYKLLNCEIFDTLFEVKVLIERWRREYNTSRLHSLHGFFHLYQRQSVQTRI